MGHALKASQPSSARKTERPSGYPAGIGARRAVKTKWTAPATAAAELGKASDAPRAALGCMLVFVAEQVVGPISRVPPISSVEVMTAYEAGFLQL